MGLRNRLGSEALESVMKKQIPGVSMGMSDESKRAVSESLKWFKDNSKTGDDGSVSTAFGIRYFMAKEIIVLYTRVPGSITERTHRRAVNLAIQSWLKNKEYRENDDILSSFLKALEVESSQLEKNREVFNVLMFLNVDESIRSLEPISILGDVLSVKSWNELSPLRVDDLWKEKHLMGRSNAIFATVENKLVPRSWDFMPVLLSLKSYGPEAAVYLASDRFDVLRAILNMSVLRGHITFFSEPKQLSVFLPTPVFGVFKSDGTMVSSYRTTEKYDYHDYRKSTIEDAWLPKAKSLLPFFEQELKYPSTSQHVLGLMRLYQAAIDLNSTSSAFLGMWQVLESAVTFGKENIRQSELVSRVSTLLNMDSMFQHSLKVLKETRNQLAHNGEFDEDDDDLLRILKLIADVCVSTLIGLGVCPSNTLSPARKV